MSQSKNQHPGLQADSFEQLRHDLMNPLATIRGRAQLLSRAVDRSTGIDDAERARLLRGLTAIDQAVIAAVEVLDHAESRPNDPRAANDR
jgi:nitrogen-specific signal transduction histidine kinase